MFNELLFLLHSIFIASFMLVLLRFCSSTGLVAGICLFTFLSNLFVTKQITLFGFDTISTDVFTIGAVFGLNLLQEYFGLAATRKAIGCNFVFMISYLVFSQLHLAYLPNAYDTTQQAFTLILQPMTRLIVASVASYMISQYFDASLYGILKRFFNNKYLLARNVLSLACSQLLDTVFFTFAALYGSVHNVFDIIVVSYAIKLLVIALNSPFILLSKKLQPKNPS